MGLNQSCCVILYFMFLLLKPELSYSMSCTSQKFTKNRIYEHCNDLPHLNCYIHWNYNSKDFSLNLAFVATPTKPNGWIAWGINPNATGMVGTQALIAFKQSNGSIVAKTFKLNSYKSIVPGELAYRVTNIEAMYSNGMMVIFASVKLPEGMKELNQVWQVGSSVLNGTFPGIHDFQPENLNSKGKLDLMKGKSISNGSEDSRLKNRNIHGILNVVSWGILFPIGIMIARYLRTFADPVWFYVHVACQLSSYTIGVAGWATGLKIGNQSKGIEYTSHRDFGIALFSLATLQAFALFLRPKKDHKYRFYWNMYHHGVGYGVLVLGIINVFKGLEILKPESKWKLAYIIFLSILGGIALILEAITWRIVLKKKPRKSNNKLYDGPNGSNGRQQPLTS
ncbi:PREDICTED: cytochrome b561 and DOMON domain-containing protein At3g25290-like [Nicotiana attenuata]|uniref:Cytochrome b561 and DOMON domain-containing protein n=1 Tax=Nicotiana attenuata TaxID=49451 RepID=A0A1J6I391_NICAT|nr:PREDICTED: cytochrome b561 and DOMON domain-containing protein At3g25290-like [Nicotiana attenuata]OIS98985.1 cytochrome b561 and domon domain-containing protein [Nicotiana attenuata]